MPKGTTPARSVPEAEFALAASFGQSEAI